MAQPKIISKKRYFPVLIIICLGIFFSVFLFLFVRNRDLEHIRDRYKVFAGDRINSIEREIAHNIDILSSLSLLYENSEHVTRKEFNNFYNKIKTKQNAIKALEWIPRIDNSDRDKYEKAAKNDGYPDFQITRRKTQGNMVRVDEKSEYFPVYYVEPYKNNEPALGYDLSTDPVRFQALKKSRDSGLMTATLPITLVQERDIQSGFLAFLPIYKSRTQLFTAQKRRENLKGFVLGVFRIKELLETALTDLQIKGVDILLYDTTILTDKKHIYTHYSRLRTNIGQAQKEINDENNRSLRVSHTINVADRNWLIECKSNPEFAAAKMTFAPYFALFIVLLFTGMLSAYLINAIGKSAKVEWLAYDLSSEIAERKKAEKELKDYRGHLEELVKKRTEDLEDSEKVLHQISCKILSSQEDERKRISRELHDGVGQALSSLKLNLQMIEQKINKNEPIKSILISDAINGLSYSIDELRNTAMALRPSFFENMELYEILVWYGNKIQNISGIKLNINIQDSTKVSSRVKDHLFRIYQESLNNIQKHAGASNVWITVIANDKVLKLNIMDNGIGFKHSEESSNKLKGDSFSCPGLGLSTMRERAVLLGGSFNINSLYGTGTTVAVEIPLTKINIEEYS